MAGREPGFAVVVCRKANGPNVSGYHGEDKYCHDKPSSDAGGNV